MAAGSNNKLQNRYLNIFNLIPFLKLSQSNHAVQTLIGFNSLMANKGNVEGASEGTTGNHFCAHTRVHLSLRVWSHGLVWCLRWWLSCPVADGGAPTLQPSSLGNNFPRKHARSVLGLVPKYGWLFWLERRVINDQEGKIGFPVKEKKIGRI